MIIIGLGNPGKVYENNFHNLGWRALDALADALNKKIKKAECSSLTVVFSRGGEPVILAKPLTYMNLSGEAAKSLLKKYKQTPQDLVVLYDDFDIERFTLRARASGSAGTHNGMKNIVSLLETLDIKRVRIGIGDKDGDKKDYVLSDVSPEDLKQYNALFDTLSSALTEYIKDKDFDKLMRSTAVKK
jgi:PTH1 family peptidyl-tRNA hydrolase